MGGVGVDQENGRFYLSKSAAGIIVTVVIAAFGLLIAGFGVWVTDHTTLSLLSSQMLDLHTRLADSTQVARLTEKVEEIDRHLEHSDTIDEESIKERNELRYRISRLEDNLKMRSPQSPPP